MKRIFTLLFICSLWSQTLLAQTAAPALRNQDVTAMLEAKLSPAIIIAKIESSACAFDTQPAALQELKNQGVAEEIILAMVRAAKNDQSAANHSPGEPKTIKIPAGTPVQLLTVESISSEIVRAGDTLTFRVAYPVVIDGVTVIADSALAFGRVTKSSQGRSFGRAGKLDWEMTEVVLADKSRAALTFARHLSGVSKGGTVTATAIVTGLIFPPLAIVSGFKRGKPAIIPAGQSFQAFLKDEVTIKD